MEIDPTFGGVVPPRFAHDVGALAARAECYRRLDGVLCAARIDDRTPHLALFAGTQHSLHWIRPSGASAGKTLFFDPRGRQSGADRFAFQISQGLGQLTCGPQREDLEPVSHRAKRALLASARLVFPDVVEERRGVFHFKGRPEILVITRDLHTDERAYNVWLGTPPVLARAPVIKQHSLRRGDTWIELASGAKIALPVNNAYFSVGLDLDRAQSASTTTVAAEGERYPMPDGSVVVSPSHLPLKRSGRPFNWSTLELPGSKSPLRAHHLDAEAYAARGVTTPPYPRDPNPGKSACKLLGL